MFHSHHVIIVPNQESQRGTATRQKPVIPGTAVQQHQRGIQKPRKAPRLAMQNTAPER
jgi:hypothetical protein